MGTPKEKKFAGRMEGFSNGSESESEVHGDKAPAGEKEEEKAKENIEQETETKKDEKEKKMEEKAGEAAFKTGATLDTLKARLQNFLKDKKEEGKQTEESDEKDKESK